MDKYEASAELKQIIKEFLESEGLELVDLIYRHEGRDLFLRVLADKPEGGITLDECARLNYEISLILDEKNILNERYILEVFSPGLDRPLSTRNDFTRCKNKKAKFFLNEPVFGKLEWDGVINRVEGGSVFIDIGGNILEMPIFKINKAKQLI